MNPTITVPDATTVPTGAAAAATGATTEWNLPIDGMSCAACAGRVEKALRAVPGVDEASVNMATEVATVRARAGVDAGTLHAAVGKAGYAVVVPPAPAADGPTPAAGGSSTRSTARWPSASGTGCGCTSTPRTADSSP